MHNVHTHVFMQTSEYTYMWTIFTNGRLHTCIHTYIYANLHIAANIPLYTTIHTCRMFIHLYTHNVYTHIYIPISSFHHVPWIHTLIHKCIHTYAHTCTCIHTYKHVQCIHTYTYAQCLHTCTYRVKSRNIPTCNVPKLAHITVNTRLHMYK